MPGRNAIIIAIDGLRASALGAYGNTWHATVALDALASESLVVEWMWCDSPGVEGFYRAAWHSSSIDRAVSENSKRASTSLPQRLASAGVGTALTTDDAWAAEQAEVSGFSEVRRIEIGVDEPASTIADTAMARLFAVAVDQVETWATGRPAACEPPAGRMLWLHVRGFHGAWDAPLALRQELLDEDDPPAPTFVAPPTLVAADDHDALLLYRAAYAAQVMVLDECVGGLLGALAELGLAEETLVVLVGCRGYALGEHGQVGGTCRSLFSEQLHVPCLIRRPGTVAPLPRCSVLAQPVDIEATLGNWFGVTASDLSPAGLNLLSSEPFPTPRRQYVTAIGDGGERALRTRAWMLRSHPGDEVNQPNSLPATERVELFAKPDDRWEANEIADRCPDIARRLVAVLDDATGVASGEAADAELDDDLITPA